MNRDTDADSGVSDADERLRAADPARGADRLRLTARDVLDRDDESSSQPAGFRRMAGWGLVAAVVVLALVGIVTIEVLRNGSADPVVAAPSDGNPPAAARCEPKARPETKLPRGAVVVRLCDSPARKDDPSAVPPVDVLRHRVDVLVDLYNGLKKLPLNPSCVLDLGPRYQLVFTYPDGSAVRIYGGLYGCEQIGNRTSSVAMLDKFADLLRQQRNQQGGRNPDKSDQLWPAGLECPLQRGSYLAPQPSELVAGLLCVGGDQTVTPNRLVRIDSTSWRRLKTDLARHSAVVKSDGSCSRSPSITLVAVDGYHDLLVVDIVCNVGWWQSSEGADTRMRWQPSADALAILKKLSGS